MATMAVTANKTPHGSVRRALIRLTPVAAVLTMGLSASAQAVDWRLTPSVGAAATFSDNAKQSSTNPEDAMILSVTPGFSLRSVGSRRVQASLQYGLIATSRFGDSESNDLDHSLNATGKAEIIEDFLFIDGSARVSQELISLLGSPAESEINSSNRATVSSYSLSPYIKKRFGTFADMQARYTATGAIFENDVAAQSSTNGLSVDLDSGTRFNDFSWGLSYSIREAQNAKIADSTFERAKVYLGYQVTRKFRLVGAVGQDWNDYLSTTETSGQSYSAGFGWAPTRRTNLTASMGERFFGKTVSVTGNHRTRSTNWTVRYAEDVSDVTERTVNFNDIQSVLFTCTDISQLPANPTVADVETTPGCTILAYKYGTSLQNGVYISKSLNAGVTWITGKSTLSLNVSDFARDFQAVSMAEDRVRSVSGAWRYRMSPDTSMNSGVTLARTSISAALAGTTVAREDDQYSVFFGLDRRFAEDLSGALTFRHTQRDSSVGTADYEENRLTATVKMSF